MATASKDDDDGAAMVIDDPLSQAMSMLDSLGGNDIGSAADDNAFDFAIDSDDDNDGEEDRKNSDTSRGLSQFDFDTDDDLLKLEDVDVSLDEDLHNGKPVAVATGGGSSAVVSGGVIDDGGGGGDGTPLTSEIDALRANLQGKELFSSNNSDGASKTATGRENNVSSSGQPKHWATKQDVAELSSTNDNNNGAMGGAVNSTTASSLDHTAKSSTDWHPLQDIPTLAPPAAKAVHQVGASHATTTSTSTSTQQQQQRTDSSSWTSTLSSFATKAAQTVQSAVAEAEAALDAGPRGPYAADHRRTQQQGGGGQPHGGIRIAQNSHNLQVQQQQQQQQQKAGQQVGGGINHQQQPKSGGLSYQERQKLLHQQYHANNNSSNNTTTINAGGGGGLYRQQHVSPSPSSLPGSNRTTPSPSPTPSAPSSPQKQQMSTTTSSTPSCSVVDSTTPTFQDKLTSNLDSSTKKKLIASAIGKLIPGERVIMFMNNLQDVKDSTFGQCFIGSDDLLKKRGLDSLLLNVGGNGVEGGNEVHVVTVWCCVMTFYRVIVFSYQATLDGKVLLLDDEEKDGEEEDTTITTSSIGNKSDNNEIIQQWLHSQNVSIQFQAAHCSLSSSNKEQNKHHVFQMPLASIERVEKVFASSQKNFLNPTSSTSNGYSAGGYILPSSSTVSSTASSAMVSAFGSQMKPLLGGMTGGTSTNTSNLLTNGSNNSLVSASGGGGGESTIASGPLGIILHAKDGGRWIQFSTSSYGDAQRAHEALNTYAFPGRRNLGYLFAFESRRSEVMASANNNAPSQQAAVEGPRSADGGGNPIATAATPTRRRFVPLEEYERQGIFHSHGSGTLASPWAPILNANANYGLCATYPSVLVGPRSIVGESTTMDGPNGSSHHGASSPTNNDNNIGLLRRCAAFRSENRFPALTWGSPNHGGSIWRSSQPKVGLQGNRSMEDERYLYAIAEEAKRANLAADARNEGGVGGGTSHGKPPIDFLRMLCGRNNESDLIVESGGSGSSNANSGCMLKIMDMRPKSAAMGNRTQGYGYENTNNYRGSTINFYGIGNIHAVRDAYQKVNALCLNPNTSDLQWMQLVENTNWPSMIRLILSAAWQTAFHVHYNRFPVLVHCSHGWDRTSQVPALAQLLLDPYYRTREGFSTLVEKDFLSFGHPFHTRCGHGEGKNEQGGDEGQLSPIFLQFLDCVFQLVNQFPDYFEFNTRYLLLLSEHIYSCRFGTLLCDSEREREVVAGTRQRTYCMWEYLDSIPELVNPMFDKEASDKAGVLIMPLPMLLRNVTLWVDRYCMYGSKATLPCVPPSLGHAYPPMYVARHPIEQPLVLHTTRNGCEGMLSRALDDAEMWKSTALAALKEVSELKKDQEVSNDDEADDKEDA